jgi:hypothetical protein
MPRFYSRNAFEGRTKLVRTLLPFPVFSPDPEFDSAPKVQRQGAEPECSRVMLVEKIFHADKERYSGLEAVPATQINFLITGIQIMIRQK